MKKMKMGKVMSVIVAGTMMMGMGMGCSAVAHTNEANEANEVNEVNEVTTVKLMTFTPSTDEGYELLDNQKVLFEEMYPGVELEITTGTMSLEDGSLTTLLNSGEDLPDVIHINAGVSRVGALANAGLIQSLDDIYDKLDLNDKVSQAALALVPRVDGKVYEVPTDMDSISCYYNKEIFEKLNLEVPTTYDEFLEVCQACIDGGYEAIAVGALDGYAVGWGFGQILQSVASTEGARQLCENETKWTDEAGVEALKRYQELVDKGYIDAVSTTRGEADAVYAFLNEKAAMYFVGAWVMTDVYANHMEDKLSTFALPSLCGEGAFATGGIGRTYCVPTGIESTAGAELWFDFVNSEEYADMMAKNETNNCIYASQAFMDAEVAAPLLQAAKDAVKDGAGRNPSVFIGTETKNAYYQNLQGIIAGMLSAEEAAENIQAGQDADIAEAE